LISAAVRPAPALSPPIAMWAAAIPVAAERTMLPAHHPVPRFLTVFFFFFFLYAQPDPAENACRGGT